MATNDYNIIDQYLNGELNEAERSAVETRVLEDKAFAEELKLRRSMQGFLRQKGNKPKLKAQLDNIGAEFFTEEKPLKVARSRRRRLFILSAVAAAAVILLAIFTWPGQTSLYQQYGAHSPLSLTEKSTTGVNTYTIEQAFNSGAYAMALPLLEQYLSDKPNDLQARISKGICLLELDRLVEARAIFKEVHEGTTALKTDGSWYLALSYLKEKNLVETRRYLELIPAGSDWGAKAAELLSKL